MQSVLSPQDATVTVVPARDGWRWFEVHSEGALRQLAERMLIDMAAAGYPVKDIARLTRVLREMVLRLFAEPTPRGGWSRGVRVRVRVGGAEVRVEAGGRFIEQLHLRKGWELAWNRYRWHGDALALITCRLVH